MQSHHPNSAILEGQTGRIASIVPNPWLARFAWLVAFCVFVLICAGGLVTRNKAALSDPTWPQFLGKPLPTKETFIGGIRYEDSHRVIAGVAGILTLVIALWAQVGNSSSVVRKVAWSGVGVVVLQALVGGLIIRFLRPPVVSMIHGVLGELYFCTMVALAVISSPRWLHDESIFRSAENDSFKFQCNVITALIFLQVAIGTSVTHLEDLFAFTLGLHIAGALLIVVSIGWLVMRIFREYKQVKPLYRGIILLKVLLAFQILLGVASIYANRARREPEMPKMHQVIESTAHLACGALILATMLVLTLRAHRLLAPSGSAINSDRMAA